MISCTSQPAQCRELEGAARGKLMLQLSLASTDEEPRAHVIFLVFLHPFGFFVSLPNFHHIWLFISYCYIHCLVAKTVMAIALYL